MAPRRDHWAEAVADAEEQKAFNAENAEIPRSGSGAGSEKSVFI